MKEALRKVALVAIVICAVFVFMGWKEMLISFSEPVDIYVDYPDDYEDVKAVETEINMILDLFAEEETTTTNRSGAVTDVSYDYYYVLPVYTEAEEEPYFVGLKVGEKSRSAYEKVVDATWDYLEGSGYELEYVNFEGGFIKMEDEAYKYFVEWFEDTEWFEDEADMDKYVLPLLLEPIDLSNMKTIALVVGAVLLVSIVILIWSFIPKKEKDVPAPTKSVMTINGVNYPIANFASVNKLMVKGKKDKAVKELEKIAKISQEEAEAIIGSWDSYWY